MARPKKVQRFKIISFKNAAGSKSWRVAGTMPDGARVRQNFADKTDALRKLGDLELELEGMPEPRQALRTLFTPEELADAEAAAQQVRGLSLSKIVAHYLNLQGRARDKGVDLDQAITFFETRYRKESKAITILNATNEFLDTRQGIAESTRENYEIGLKLLQKPDPNRYVHDFTIGDLETILKKYKKVASQRTFRTLFSSFFAWAVRHHYCLENPCKRFDKLPKDMSQIAALTLEEANRLLVAASQFKNGEAAAVVAIGLFSGLRPSEIRDLKAEDILKEKIRVTGGKLRRQLKRSVPIHPVLAAWLEKYPFKGLPDGWDSKLKVLKKVTKAKRWVPDIIRHTSITFQTERDKNEALTAYNCGTSIEMMNRHYRDTIDDDETIAAFWALTPEKLKVPDKAVELPSKTRIAWPDKASLKKLVWNKPMIHAAKDLGVSDVALRKQCLKLGIELPPRGHWLKS